MNIFISCVSLKRDIPCKGSDMYISPLFKKSLAFARKLASDDHIFILSAKYYILKLTDIIEPYNLTLCGKSKEFKKNWGKQVYKKASMMGINLNNSIYLAGQNYIEGLKPYININTIKEPLKGLSIGKRLRVLTKIIQK